MPFTKLDELRNEQADEELDFDEEPESELSEAERLAAGFDMMLADDDEPGHNPKWWTRWR